MNENVTLDDFAENEGHYLKLGPRTLDLPELWDKIEFGDAFSYQRGLNYSSDNYVSEGEGMIFLTLNAIAPGGGLKKDSLKFYDDDIPEEKTTTEGDILMANTDLNQDGEIIGYPVRVPSFDTDVQKCFSHHLLKIQQTQNRYDSRFLEYLFSAKYIHDRMIDFSCGSTVLNLNTDLLESLELPVPPLKDQRKIATVLYNVDQAIQKTEEIIEQTERIGKGLRDSLFTEGYYEHETEHYGTLGDVPVDWEKTRLYKISDVARGKFTHRPRNDPDFYDGEYPFIQTGEVVKSVGELTDYSQTLNERGREVSREFAPGTIIITIAGNIGDTAVATFPVYFPDSLVGITPDKDVDERFLEHFLRYRQNFLNRLSTKTTQKNLNLTLLRPIEVLKPPIEEQKEIAELLTTVDNRIKKEREYKHQLERLKKGLMQDLLSGTVRTTDTNIEVPDEIAQNG